MTGYVWLFTIPILLYFIGGLFAAHRIRAAKFESRKAIPFYDIYNSHFIHSKISKKEAEELWLEAAEALKISPYKLRPSDNFNIELKHYISIFPFIDLNDDFFYIAIKRLKSKNIDPLTAKNVKTLADYIELVASKSILSKSEQTGHGGAT